MTNREKQEALFDALLKVAVSEAFQRELRELPAEGDPEKEIPPSPELDQRIHRQIVGARRKSGARRFVKKAGRVAAVFCVVLTLASILLLSVEASRNQIFNAILQMQEKYTQLHFGDSEEEPGDGIYRPTYLPEGFQQQSEQKFGTSVELVYINQAKEQIRLTQGEYKEGSSLVDNENRKFEKIKVLNNTAYFFGSPTQGEPSVLIWRSGDTTFKLQASLSAQELIRIGESLKK